MNTEEFQNLLRRAIGERSRAEFAKRSEISAIQLHRWLKKEDPPRPSVKNLQKIARCASGGVTYRDLLAACGYSDAELDFYSEEQETAKGEKKDRVLLPEHERVAACEEDILKGFSEMTNRSQVPYNDVDEFVEMVNLLYSVEDLCFDVGNERINDLEIKEKPNGKYYVPLTISWASGERDEEAYHFTKGLIFYYKTEDGQVMISQVTFSGKDLIAYRIITIKDGGLEFLEKKPIITISKKRDQKKNHTTQDEMRAAETVTKLLMDGIREYPDIVSGHGFEFRENLPKLKDFLLSHKDAFAKTPSDEERLEELLRGERPPAEIYQDYEDRSNWEEGVGALVATIMTEETGFTFTYWAEHEGGFYDPGIDPTPHSYILIEEINERAAEVELGTLYDILCRYCVELGIREFGMCYARITTEPDFNDMFRVLETEDGAVYEQIPANEMLARYPRNKDTAKKVAVKKLTEAIRTVNLLADESASGEAHEMMLREVSLDLRTVKDSLQVGEITKGI